MIYAPLDGYGAVEKFRALKNNKNIEGLLS